MDVLKIREGEDVSPDTSQLAGRGVSKGLHQVVDQGWLEVLHQPTADEFVILGNVELTHLEEVVLHVVDALVLHVGFRGRLVLVEGPQDAEVPSSRPIVFCHLDPVLRRYLHDEVFPLEPLYDRQHLLEKALGREG